MLSDDEILAAYQAAFGPLHHPDPEWLRDAVSWCRRVIEAETEDEAAQAMATWAADGDGAAARDAARQLRDAAGITAEAPPSAAPPRTLPPPGVLTDGTRLCAHPDWAWWKEHRLPVWVEEGAPGTADWRRAFADGELVRAWLAAGWAVLPDTTDPTVRGWAHARIRGTR